MAVTVPDWADTLLDLIGVAWPNVDEDAYRAMADSLREFAEDLLDDGQLANNHVERLLSASKGESIEALNRHWNTVKGKHFKDIADAARTIAGAMDMAADAVETMKYAALVQLGYLAAEAGIALSLIPVTAGLSALFGAAAMRLTQEVVKRLIKECVEEAVGYIVSAMTEPAVAALEGMAADLVVQLGSMALGFQDGVDLDQTKNAGKEGFDDGVKSGKEALHLASAGGSGAGGGGGTGLVDLHIEHSEHARAGTSLNSVSTNIHGKTTTHLTKAKSHHGRTRGRDSIAQAIDPVADKAMAALVKATKAMGDHVGTTLPKAVKKISTDHKKNDDAIHDAFNRLNRKNSGGGDGTGPGRDAGGKGTGSGGADGSAARGPKSTRDVKDDPRRNGVPLNSRRCETDPVDVASGQMVLAHTDLALPGVLPLLLRRTHVSGYDYGRSYGPGWASTVDERLDIDVDGLGGSVWAREDGSLLFYPRLPRDECDAVLPVACSRLPLRLVERTEFGDVTYAISDAHSGLTRTFTGNPYHGTACHWLSSIKDRNDNAVHFHREADGRPISATHEGGYRVDFTTDPTGLLTAHALRTPDGQQTLHTFGYDEAGNLRAVAHDDSAPLLFDYDGAGRITSWTDRHGAAYSYDYDTAGRVVRTTGPDGMLSSRFSYATDPHHPDLRITRFTDSTGAVTTHHVNGLGQVVAETDPLGHTVLRQWDGFDNLLARTDPLGNTARFTYDDQDNLIVLDFPDGTRSTAQYNDLNLLVGLTGPDGATWRQEYDERGNRTAVLAPDGSVARFGHDENGAVISRTDPTGAVERLTRDAAGLALTLSDSLGNSFSVVRDAFGRPVEGTDPQGAVTRTEWSPQGWALRATAPDGGVESWTWDAEGNCTAHTDAAGDTTHFEYGPFDLLTARTGADGARYEFRHDTELRLVQVRNPQGLTWDYTYDAAGNMTRETDFDGRSLHYAYDAAGRIVSVTTPTGEVITSEYDTCGRVTGKHVGAASTRYRYDTAGQLTSAVSTAPSAVDPATASASSVTLERDPLGRIVAETVNGRTMRYAYDVAGRVAARTTPGGTVSRASYDTAGRRSSLLVGGHHIGFDRDGRGRELTRTIGTDDRPLVIGSTWDTAGRLATRRVTAGDRTLRSRAYGYRADGHLDRLTDELDGVTVRFEMDPVGRPLRVTAANWQESYAYDLAGNQTAADWPDRAHRIEGRGERTYHGTRLLGAGNIRCEYDEAGRTVARHRTTLSGRKEAWRYTWDAENRMTSCRTPDGVLWRYDYDPLGRRTAKHRMAQDDRTAVHSVYFAWDGNRLAEQVDTAHATVTTWEYDGYLPLAQWERRLLAPETPPTAEPQADQHADARFFAIITDLVGAPSELVDEDGHIAWQARATVWGATTWNRNAAAYTPLRMPGQYDDAETGLYYNLHRHYDPQTARYASPDPLGLGAAANPVAYVLNPHRWSDPEGLIAKGCTEHGGWYSGLSPANLKNADGTRRTDTNMEVNHIPAKNAYAHLDEPGFKTNKDGGGAGMGPAIRMEYDDHRGVTSTGSSAESIKWRAEQRALIDAGRWDLAMKKDIDEIRELYGDKYDTHIADMVESLKVNKKFQKMLEKRGWEIDYEVLK
ncbi:RHS repeat-associated core domain-containing protein [Streptomyces virginiae]